MALRILVGRTVVSDRGALHSSVEESRIMSTKDKVRLHPGYELRVADLMTPVEIAAEFTLGDLCRIINNFEELDIETFSALLQCPLEPLTRLWTFLLPTSPCSNSFTPCSGNCRSSVRQHNAMPCVRNCNSRLNVSKLVRND